MGRPSYLAIAIVVLAVLTGAAGWFVLPAMESGVASSVGPMWVRPATATRRPTNTPAPWALTATAKAIPRTPTPVTTTTPTVVPSPSATPKAQVTNTPVPGARPRITGSQLYRDRMEAGLDMMARVSPADYLTVTTYVGEILESGQNYSRSTSRTVEVSTGSASLGAPYAGSMALHEATHLKNWHTNNVPAWGCDGEAKSLSAQAAYLRKAGANDLADWAESLRGSWC